MRTCPIEFHEFGDMGAPALMMLHGACMSWSLFSEAAAVLSARYHLLIPAMSGHDFENDGEFTSVEEIAAELADWLVAHGYEDIYLYGLSMGGGIATRFLADGRVRVRAAVIDAGIMPYSYPRVLTRFIAAKDLLVNALGRASLPLTRMAFPPERYGEGAAEEIHRMLQHMTLGSLYRTFESTDNYELSVPIDLKGARVEYWYGAHEKKARKDDLKVARLAYPGVPFIEIPNCDHAEFLTHTNEFCKHLAASLEGE